MNKVLTLTACFFILMNFHAVAQEDPLDKVINAIRGSDSRGLSALFNPTLELQLPGNQSTCSASQAEMIMKDFFKKNPPDTLTVIQKGTTDPSSLFAICSFVSGPRKYQVYLYLRKEKDRFLVQKIQFEEKK